jgi:hypothetical protein
MCGARRGVLRQHLADWPRFGAQKHRENKGEIVLTQFSNIAYLSQNYCDLLDRSLQTQEF